jgi:hypothetical protein
MINFKHGGTVPDDYQPAGETKITALAFLGGTIALGLLWGACGLIMFL